MSNQKNEIVESNRKNGIHSILYQNNIIEFDKEESDFIKQGFRLVAKELLDLDSTNGDDIRAMLNHWHDKMNMNGVTPHKIKNRILAKMGYCEDGKTTFEERQKKLLTEKQQNDSNLASISLEKKQKLDEEITFLTKQREELLKNPVVINEGIKSAMLEKDKTAQSLLENLKAQQFVELQKFMQLQIESFNKIAQEHFNKVEIEKNALLEQAKIEAIKKSKAELLEITKKQSEINTSVKSPVEKGLEEDTKKKDLELLRIQYQVKTVLQLQDIAQQKGIQFTKNMRKQELIDALLG